MRNGLSLREIIRKVIEGNLDYHVRFKESEDFSNLFYGIDDMELIEEMIHSIEPKNYYKIPDQIRKKVLLESDDKKLKELLLKTVHSNENYREFKIWGLKTLINTFSSELFWVLTNNQKLPQIGFNELIANINKDVLGNFDIDQNVLLKKLENIPNFYGSDETQKKIILIGEILKLFEEKNPVKVPFDKKFKAFLIRAKIYSDILVEKFNGSRILSKRIEKLLNNF